MNPDDIDLEELHERNNYPTPVGGPDYEGLALDEAQQDDLKEFMCMCTPEQLRCAARCLNSLADHMIEELQESITVEDFEAKKKDSEEEGEY